MSAPPDMPYSEMAGNCEALLVGKQQKMSAVMSAQQNREGLVSISTKEGQPRSHAGSGFLKVLTCLVVASNVSYSNTTFFPFSFNVLFLSIAEIGNNFNDWKILVSIMFHSSLHLTLSEGVKNVLELNNGTSLLVIIAYKPLNSITSR